MGNLSFIGKSGSSGWESDGADGIQTDKKVTINTTLTGKFIPQNDIAANMQLLYFDEGEIVTTSDEGQIIIGDNNRGGKIIYDKNRIVKHAAYDWTETNLPVPYEINEKNFVYGNGRFILLTSDYLYVTTDFITWTSIENNLNSTFKLSKIFFANGAFFATMEIVIFAELRGYSSIWTSVDGISWTAFSDNDTGTFIASNNEVTLVYDHQTNYETAEYTITIKQLIGKSTRTVVNSNFNTLHSGALFVDDQFYCSDGAFFFIPLTESFFLFSIDNGVTWTKVTTPGIVSKVVKFNGQLFISTASSLLQSDITDPTNFNSINFGFSWLYYWSNFSNVNAKHNQLFALYYIDASNPIYNVDESVQQIITSYDGQIWYPIYTFNGDIYSEIITLNNGFCIHTNDSEKTEIAVSITENAITALPPKTINGDINFDGIILSDKQTGTPYRLVIENGVLTLEAV